jgi:hypothetical protein
MGRFWYLASSRRQAPEKGNSLVLTFTHDEEKMLAVPDVSFPRFMQSQARPSV